MDSIERVGPDGLSCWTARWDSIERVGVDGLSCSTACWTATLPRAPAGRRVGADPHGRVTLSRSLTLGARLQRRGVPREDPTVARDSQPSDWIDVSATDHILATERDGDIVLSTTGGRDVREGVGATSPEIERR